MVSEKIRQGAALPHGHPHRPGVVVAGGGAAAPFVVVADVGDGNPAHRAFHPVAVAIVNEGGRGCTADAGQVVFGVPSLAFQDGLQSGCTCCR